MAGLIGFSKSLTQPDSSILIKKMADALENEPRFQREFLIQSGIAAGLVSLKINDEGKQPFWDEDQNTAVFFYGELFDIQDLRKKVVEKNLSLGAKGFAELVLRLYQAYGLQFATFLNGAFLIVIWEGECKRLTVINDRLGLYPLYYHERNGELIFSSGIRAVLADPSVPREVDRTAVSEFLTFDHILGQRTMLKSVKLMPQASIMRWQEHRLEIKRYHTLEFLDTQPLRSTESYLEEFQHHLHHAVQRQSQGNGSKGLMLSGGMDSRYILALLRKQHPGNGLHTFTWSIPNSDDERFARESAKKAGTQHHFFELDPNWLLHKGRRAVQLTEGNANIVNLHALAALDQESRIANIIFKGFMGDAMMGFGIRPRFWADYDEKTRMEVHLEAYRDYRVLTFDTPQHEEIFSDTFLAATKDDWREDFRTGMNASGSDQMNDQRIYFDLTQRVPRMTINGVEVTRDQALVRLPFADNDLLDFSLKVPPWLRLDRTLMVQAFIKYFPEYARIPLAQTRLPMISCAREVVQKNLQFIQWHLRNRGLSWLAGPSSRPYKDYNKWFRTNLRPWVEENLLSPKHLQRGYFKPETVRDLVQDHMQGANHAVRIGALLSVELFHQQFID